MPEDAASRPIVVRGTDIVASDTERMRRRKLARITLDSMVQFVGLLDVHGTVLEINKVALDAVGIGLPEVEGQPFWTTFWWQVSEEIRATLRTAIARAAQGEFVRWDTEIFGRAGGRETIVIDASLCPVVDDEGRVVFLCAEGRDITEKKAREREVAHKNIELQGLLERIRELDEIKTQFFANVSHELRTPLALILGPAQRILDDPQLPQAARLEAADVIARNARLLLKHVNDLLEMSRLESGKLKIELADTDVAALLRFVASHFAALAAERGIELTVDAERACRAAVDADKLGRVFMNLIANAFKFVPAGGRVGCALRASAAELTAVIDDSGPGIAPALRRTVFERFRQGDGGMQRKAGGTGLGLAIAKEFVEMHKGRIAVLDSPLGGARFEVVLPRPALRVAPPAGRGPAPFDSALIDGVLEELRPPGGDGRLAGPSAPVGAVPAGGRPRVLVVEDNRDMNRFITQCLVAEYDVVSAFDGGEAIEAAQRWRPSLVVADLMMPEVSGVEMIERMRALPELRALPVLVLSAKADEQLMVRLLDEGAADYVVKPFSERELQVRVRNLIAALRAREQLEALREAAESASRAKDDFLAMLGHELRNPLSPIVTALHLMKMQSPQAAESARAVIERQVQHLVGLVDDLLDVSRISRGKLELKRQAVDFADVVGRAVEMVGPLIGQRAHALAVDVPQDVLRVDGDPVRLEQIVANLLTNAAKYTPRRGRIDVRAEREGGAMVLRVRDSGIGISPDVLPHVFDLFVQERQAIDRSAGGLGLGLSIVRSLAEGHGGSVSAASEGIGRGSEFTLRLPLAPAAAAAASERSAAGEDGVGPGMAPRRVLIVDDNRDGASMFALALEQQGHTLRVAHDGPSALALAREFLPDVALVDIGLPVMNGYELARRLRELPGLGALRLIALTGYGQPSDRRRSDDAGFDLHLVKPVAPDVIDGALRAPPARPH